MRLKVTIDKAAGLAAADMNGKSDPYVKFHWRGQKYKTEVKKKTLDPEWSQSFLIDYDRANDPCDLVFEIFDWDLVSRNDPLGTVTVGIGGLYVQCPPLRGAYQVQSVANVDASGMGLLYLCIQVVAGDVHTEGPLNTMASPSSPSTATKSSAPRQHIVSLNRATGAAAPGYRPPPPGTRLPPPNYPVYPAQYPASHYPPAYPPQYPNTPGSMYTDVTPARPPPIKITEEWKDAVKALQAVLPHTPLATIQIALARFNGDREQALNYLLENQLVTSKPPASKPPHRPSVTWHYSGEAASPISTVASPTFDAFSAAPPPTPRPQVAVGVSAAPQYEADMTAVMQAQGRRKALLIGINYTGTANALRGCISDVKRMRQALVSIYGFPDRPEAIVCLCDDQNDSRYRPTRKNIIYGMQWLVKDAAPGDAFFFHYSGHGTQVSNVDGTEADGMDEVIMPEDFKTAGVINDDELHRLLVEPLPSLCRLTAVMDCCHSGSGLDLPLVWMKNKWEEEYAPFYTAGDVQLFSGCMDTQTSADMSGGGGGFLNFGAGGGGEAGGAMTTAFLTAVTADPFGQTYIELLDKIRKGLKARGLQQVPQLSSTQRFPIDRPFNLTDVVPNHHPQLGRSQHVNARAKRLARQERYKNLLSDTGPVAAAVAAQLVMGLLSSR